MGVSCASFCNTHARACASCRFEGRAAEEQAGRYVPWASRHTGMCRAVQPCHAFCQSAAVFSVSHCPNVAPRMCCHANASPLNCEVSSCTAAHACRRDPCGSRRTRSPYPGCGAPAWLLLALEARREGSTRGEERLVGWEGGGLCERSTRVGFEGVDLNALGLVNLRVSLGVGAHSHRLSHASRSAPGTCSAEAPGLVFALSFSPPPPRAPSLEGALKRRSCRCQPSHGQR